MWCISEVNFPPFSRSAAWRIRSSACLTRARPCIRCMSRCNEFPLTRPLLSTASAAGRPALFGRFFDSMGLSDSSGLCIIGYAFRLPSAPQIAFDRGEAGGLPDSSNVCPHMHGVSDPGWPQPVSHNDVLNVAFRLPRRRRHHRLEGFRGSTPSLCVPLSTLRPQPHDRRRMTRGRGGLLSLPRMALSSTTLCLLTGALRGSITSLALRPVCRTVYASACSLPLTLQDSFPGGWLGLVGEGISPSEWVRLRLGALNSCGPASDDHAAY